MHSHRSRVDTLFAPLAVALSRVMAAQMDADQSQEACTNELIKTRSPDGRFHSCARSGWIQAVTAMYHTHPQPAHCCNFNPAAGVAGSWQGTELCHPSCQTTNATPVSSPVPDQPRVQHSKAQSSLCRRFLLKAGFQLRCRCAADLT